MPAALSRFAGDRLGDDVQVRAVLGTENGVTPKFQFIPRTNNAFGNIALAFNKFQLKSVLTTQQKQKNWSMLEISSLDFWF